MLVYSRSSIALCYYQLDLRQDTAGTGRPVMCIWICYVVSKKKVSDAEG